MNKSDSIKQLAVALNKFQSEVSNPKKTERNPFHGSKYAPLSSVIDQVKPVLDKQGLCFSQLVSGDGEKSSVTTLLMHESGEWIESEPLTFPNQISKGDSAAQGGGSSITYARRYSLEAILGISSEDDNDGNSNNKHDKNNNANSGNSSQNKSGSNNKKSRPSDKTMPFGKHKGAKLNDIDDSYLEWVAKHAEKDWLKAAAQDVLDKRKNNSDNKVSNQKDKNSKYDNQGNSEMSKREREISELVSNDEALKNEVYNALKYDKEQNPNTKTVDDLSDETYNLLLDTLMTMKDQNSDIDVPF